MILSTLSTVFLGFAVSIPSVVAGPCKPGSSQPLDAQTSTVTATSLLLDITATALSSEPITIQSFTTSQESTSLPAVTTSVAPPETFTGGRATWYRQNGSPAGCGGTYRDDDLVVALDYRRFDRSLCGRKLRVTNSDNGQTVYVTVIEACPTCLNQNSLDLSEGAFSLIGSLSDGEYPVTWSYV